MFFHATDTTTAGFQLEVDQLAEMGASSRMLWLLRCPQWTREAAPRASLLPALSGPHWSGFDFAQATQSASAVARVWVSGNRIVPALLSRPPG